MADENRIFGTSRGAAFVNIKVALVKWLPKHSFVAEYTIRQLPTDDQHAKDGFCGKKLVMRYFSLKHYLATFCRCRFSDIRLISLRCDTNSNRSVHPYKSMNTLHKKQYVYKNKARTKKLIIITYFILQTCFLNQMKNWDSQHLCSIIVIFQMAISLKKNSI